MPSRVTNTNRITFKQTIPYKWLDVILSLLFYQVFARLHDERNSYLPIQCWTLLKTMNMETLPSELKLNILRQVDFPTLKALVHASPAYHAVYRSSRLEMLTSATLFHLATIGLNLKPIFQWYQSPDHVGAPDSWYLLVGLRGLNYSRTLLKAAFESYWRQLEERGVYNHPIKLSFNHCTTLLAIEEIKGYVRFDEVVKCFRGPDVVGRHEDERFGHQRILEHGLIVCLVKDGCHHRFLASKS